jgi:von Willebrand factor type A domain
VCALLLGSCGSRTPLDGFAPLPDESEPAPVDPPPTAPPAAGSGGMPSVKPTTPSMPPKPPCEAVEVTIDKLRPSVTLLVDQSGSMGFGYPDRRSPESRWQIVRAALLDEKTGVVRELEQSIQFGLSFYTSHNGYSGGVCPILTEVQSVTGNYAAIRALYDGTSPDDDTPTGAAIEAVVSAISVAARKGPEVLLLVTDGEADSCDVPDPQLGQGEAVAAATLAHSAGIDFYVLGISTDISAANLQQLANAGQGKPLDAVWGQSPDAAQPYQAKSDVSGLTQQLRDILARVPLCEIELDREVSASELTAGSVALDGKALEHGAPDGFRLKDPRHLEVVGKACESLRAAGKELRVRISCD